jgi:hypothetical protein
MNATEDPRQQFLRPRVTLQLPIRNEYYTARRVIEAASFAGDANTPPPDSGTNANWTGSVTTTYNGEVTTVVDQANKQRRSTMDGLGRLLVERGRLASTLGSSVAVWP